MSHKIIILVMCLFWTILARSQTLPERPSNYYDLDAGLEQNPYHIHNLGNLRWLSEMGEEWFVDANTLVYFLQTADIEAVETEDWIDGFIPIGYYYSANNIFSPQFYGVYDGENHRISNLYIKTMHLEEDAATAGLFSLSLQATIKNVHLINILIDPVSGHLGLNQIGGISGMGYFSSFYNCSVTGRLQASFPNQITCIGGIVGQSGFDQIDNCSSSAIISGNIYVGGIVGFNIGNIENSYSTSSLSGEIIGGIVGAHLSRDINNSYFSGTLITVGNITNSGGIVGYLLGIGGSSTIISNSFWDIETSENIHPIGNLGSEIGDIINCYGLLTFEMKSLEPYIENGWDFDDIWDINPDINEGYPNLRANIPPITYIKDNTLHSYINTTAYPNPFNPNITILFYLPKSEKVSLKIYNAKGQLVKILIDETLENKTHSAIWDGLDCNSQKVSSGAYFYKLETATFSTVKKILLLK